jgi:glutamate carboxypeptidase
MKGGLVVAITALRLLSEQRVSVPIRLVIVSDEEVGSPEGEAVLVRELRGASCALVFEAGRAHDAIITARKGTGSLRVTSRGPAAIVSLAAFIQRASAITDYERGVTVNAGTLHGENTSAVADFDFRFIATPDGVDVAARLTALADELDGDFEVTGGVARPPLQRTDENFRLYQEYAACASLAGLGSGESPLLGGGSDASTTALLGVPSIDGLGPRGRGFHTHDEQIEVSTLPMRLEALLRFLWQRQV